MKLRVLLMCLAIAGCTEVAIAPTDVAAVGAQAPPPPPLPFSPRRPESADPLDPCFAGSYLDLIGKQVSTIGIAETPTFRLIRPESMVTEDFVSSRVNALVEPSGMISSVYCG